MQYDKTGPRASIHNLTLFESASSCVCRPASMPCVSYGGYARIHSFSKMHRQNAGATEAWAAAYTRSPGHGSVVMPLVVSRPASMSSYIRPHRQLHRICKQLLTRYCSHSYEPRMNRRSNSCSRGCCVSCMFHAYLHAAASHSGPLTAICLPNS